MLAENSSSRYPRSGLRPDVERARKLTRNNVSSNVVELSGIRNPVSTFPTWQGSTTAGKRWTIYCGDAASVLRQLPNNSFHCVVTSPPYFWLRDYQVDGQIGREDTVTDYITALSVVMSEVFRVLKPSGTLFLNLGDTYYSARGESKGVDEKNKKRRFGLRAVDRGGGLGLGLRPKTLIGIPWRAAIHLSEKGWILRSSIVWHRNQTVSEPVLDRPSRSYEHIFLFAKSRHYHFNKSSLLAESPHDLWTFPNRPSSAKGVRTAPFPDELVERCLALGCPRSGNVLDPFVGSGTTLRVAARRGCHATGIDLNESYCRAVAKQMASQA